MTTDFGRKECIRCGKKGHLSHECKAPVLPPQPPIYKPPPLPPVEADLDTLHDLYDDYLTGG